MHICILQIFCTFSSSKMTVSKGSVIAKYNVRLQNTFLNNIASLSFFFQIRFYYF